MIKFLWGLSLFFSKETWAELKAAKVSKRRLFFGILMYLTDKGFRRIIKTKLGAIAKSGINEKINSGESVIAILTSDSQRRVIQ